MSRILGAFAVLAVLMVVPVQAEMTSVSDSELDAVSGKGNATVAFGAYDWFDDHATDASQYKGALDNQGTISLTGINTANVWGAYAGADALNGASATGTTASDATANMAIGGF